MPRIKWEEAYGLAIDDDDAESVQNELIKVVADAINEYDKSFFLDPNRHIDLDPSVRDKKATVNTHIMVSIHGLRKPPRVEHTDDIGHYIRRTMHDRFTDLGVRWALGIYWDEDGFYDEEDDELDRSDSLRETAEVPPGDHIVN